MKTMLKIKGMERVAGCDHPKYLNKFTASVSHGQKYKSLTLQDVSKDVSHACALNFAHISASVDNAPREVSL